MLLISLLLASCTGWTLATTKASKNHTTEPCQCKDGSCLPPSDDQSQVCPKDCEDGCRDTEPLYRDAYRLWGRDTNAHVLVDVDQNTCIDIEHGVWFTFTHAIYFSAIFIKSSTTHAYINFKIEVDGQGVSFQFHFPVLGKGSYLLEPWVSRRGTNLTLWMSPPVGVCTVSVSAGLDLTARADVDTSADLKDNLEDLFDGDDSTCLSFRPLSSIKLVLASPTKLGALTLALENEGASQEAVTDVSLFTKMDKSVAERHQVSHPSDDKRSVSLHVSTQALISSILIRNNDSSNVNSSVALCAVYVWGVLSCPDGFFGPTCDKRCADNCTDHRCTPVFGLCSTKCRRTLGGFWTESCDEGYWGPRCENKDPFHHWGASTNAPELQRANDSESCTCDSAHPSVWMAFRHRVNVTALHLESKQHAPSNVDIVVEMDDEKVSFEACEDTRDSSFEHVLKALEPAVGRNLSLYGLPSGICSLYIFAELSNDLNACQTGFWGSNCTRACPDQCVPHKCQRLTGICFVPDHKEDPRAEPWDKDLTAALIIFLSASVVLWAGALLCGSVYAHGRCVERKEAPNPPRPTSESPGDQYRGFDEPYTASEKGIYSDTTGSSVDFLYVADDAQPESYAPSLAENRLSTLSGSSKASQESKSVSV